MAGQLMNFSVFFALGFFFWLGIQFPKFFQLLTFDFQESLKQSIYRKTKRNLLWTEYGLEPAEGESRALSESPHDMTFTQISHLEFYTI